MALTLEDINAIDDATLTPELEAALLPKIEARAIKHLETKGHIVKPKATYDTEFTAELTKQQKAWADSDAPKYYGSVERMLATVGFVKPAEMKTRDFVQKLSDEGKLPFTPEQIAKIDKALKGDATPESATATALAAQAKKELEDFKKSIEEGKKGDFTKAVGRVVSSSLKAAPVLIDPALKTDAEKTAAKTATINDITAVFNTLYEAGEDEAGVLFFKKKGTDAPIMNTATGEPMTPLEITRANHRIYLAPEGHQQQGGGTGKPAGTSGAASSKADIYKAAAEQGLRMYSEEWKKYVAEQEGKK